MRRRAKGDLESEVLATLWAADRALAPGDVVDALGGDLAYNTVQTILTRLHAKGAVRREQRGRAHAYTPVLDEAGMAASRMRAVLDARGDRTAVLSHFLDGLSAEDEKTLLHLLDRPRGVAAAEAGD